MTHKDIIKHRMREAGNNQVRPEQERLHEILIRAFYDCEVRMEYPIFIPTTGKMAWLDNAIVTKKIGYRIMGESHSYGDLKDELQKEGLEKLGWKIWDIWFDKHKELWRK